jgi:tetratricopeptide (TPR) repeat protein
MRLSHISSIIFPILLAVNQSAAIGQDTFTTEDKELGEILYESGRYENALQYYQEKLETQRARFGAEAHPDIAASLMFMGVILYQLGRYHEALKCHHESLEISKNVYKAPSHPSIAGCLLNIGNVLYDLGRNEEALHSFQEALGIYTIIYGTQPHHQLAACLLNIGSVFDSLLRAGAHYAKKYIWCTATS